MPPTTSGRLPDRPQGARHYSCTFEASQLRRTGERGLAEAKVVERKGYVTPAAIYRLQLQPAFDFDAAASMSDYLAELGITHAYCSPYLQPVPGSTHGYDIVDYGRVNDELGGESGHQRFLDALRRNHLGQVLDIVPNHMAISALNRWWADVLENGPSSQHASYFDVDWDPPEARLRNLVLLPVLADHYGRVLERSEILLIRHAARFEVTYKDHRYPVSPSSLGPLLGRAARQAKSDALAYLADAFNELPRPTARDRASVRRRRRDQEVLRAELERLIAEDEDVRTSIDQTVAAINQDADALHSVLELQNYRLARWRSAGRDLGYRRFFDINDLIGLRMEDEQVFDDTHRLIIEWVRSGAADGLRVDHPDGLRDPQQYFERLRAAAPDAWIVAEKILQPGEPLPSWPIEGSAGYDFLNLVTRLLVDPAGEVPLTATYSAFTGEPTDYARVAHDRKLFVARDVLGSDVNRLASLLVDVCERHRRYRDYSRHELTEALRELIACFPVYRTYVRPEAGEVSEQDRRSIQEAVKRALANAPELEPALLEFLARLLVLDITGPLESEFVARFQQITGPAMAKGIEDTAYYVFNRFIALNEVGGDPSQFAVSVDQFHAWCADAVERRPFSMLATSTHDTKRSEDVRARLALLSECPDEWAGAVRRWTALAEPSWDGSTPDRNVEYYFYQTLVGAWPLAHERARAHMLKVIREAKSHTSWTSPQQRYETALMRFVDGVFENRALMDDVRRFAETLIRPGWVNALAQLLLKLTCPGVPDVYQGTELWSLQLVDPDNRQPIDYRVRAQIVADSRTRAPSDLWEHAEDGAAKLWVIQKALETCRAHPDAFGAPGAYEPLRTSGPEQDRVVAFSRAGEVVVVVPRLVLRADRRWQDTFVCLPPGNWRNVFADTDSIASRETDLSRLWASFPVALLERATDRVS